MKAIKNDLLTVGAVLGMVLLALAPVFGLFWLACVILKYLLRRVDIMMQRYGFIVYEENGQMRDTGSEPLNEQMYSMIEQGVMQRGFKIDLMYSDADYDKVKEMIQTNRKIRKETGVALIDNIVKVPRW